METAESARAPIAVTEPTDAAAPADLKLGLSHVQVDTVLEDGPDAPSLERVP